MKKTLRIVLVLASLASLASCMRFETVKGDPMKTKIYTLDNGMKVFMTVNREQPRVQTYMAVRVGAKNDPLETTGLAHYFEHLMFKGTESFGTSDYEAEKPMLDEIEALFEEYRQTSDETARRAIYHRIDSISYEASKIAIPNEYDKLMAVIGAKGTNAWTSNDETVYVEDIPSNQIDAWARIQADRFRNCVVRGFHTELETIYEEKNMSLTDDQDKTIMALFGALYPEHPYGIHDVLGFQDHLKNPSITNVKKYHDTWYVPNNIAVCLSGDFNPKEVVRILEKHFGDWQPNEALPERTVPELKQLESPVETSVYGLEAENVFIGWPVPANCDLRSSAVASVASDILCNGQAGLMDIDLAMQQKVLACDAGTYGQADAGTFLVIGMPREGQSLEEVRDLLLSEVARLRDGDFDPALIMASVNNMKLSRMRSLESNSRRAQKYVSAFISGVEWKDACRDIEILESVTPEDVQEWAARYLTENGWCAVYKRMGEDTSIQKISKPAITPIVTNRDSESAFLAEVKAAEVVPIEPVFVDFGRDMSVLRSGETQVLYKKNELNDIFDLGITFNSGKADLPGLDIAFDYLSYLGTPDFGAEEFAMMMYGLGCSYSVNAGVYSTTVNVSGLSENMQEALSLILALAGGAEGDPEILEELKADMLKARTDAKLSQQSCFRALQSYAFYGSDYIRSTTLSNADLAALGSDDLLSKVRSLVAEGCEISYYGPMKPAEVLRSLDGCLALEGRPAIAPERHAPTMKTGESCVTLAQYDAPQVYYIQYSNDGRLFDPARTPEYTLYNEYFGGGMNSVVFQEMREARGLAYSAWADLGEPSYADESYTYMAFIATQNDKVRTAVEAFDEIIENMPESEAAFHVARESILGRLRTTRTTGRAVLRAYRECRRLGLDEPAARDIFEKVSGMSLEDVKAVQKDMVAGRSYNYCILGDIRNLDGDFLRTLGPVKAVSLEDIFGY